MALVDLVLFVEVSGGPAGDAVPISCVQQGAVQLQCVAASLQQHSASPCNIVVWACCAVRRLRVGGDEKVAAATWARPSELFV
jgi:hypothetical protein